MRRAEPPSDSGAAPGGEPRNVSRDALLAGAVSVLQPRKGYRINVDAVLLADFVARNRKGPLARVVDLGSGVGAVTLVLNHLTGIHHAALVEREPELCALARTNLRANRVEGDVHVVDLAVEGLPAALRAIATAVVVNPPFFASAATRPHKDAAVRRARSGALQPFLAAAAEALGRRGKAYFVYPAVSLVQLMAAGERRGLIAKRLCFVHPFSNAPARIALVEFTHGKPGGLIVEPPLVEWQARGVASSEISGLLRGRAIDRK